MQLKRPISGPPFAAYAAIICTSIYVVLLRDPTGATAEFMRTMGLPPILPLGGDFAHSLSLLCLLTVPLQNRGLVAQPAFARRISEALERWVPGFRAVLVPSEIGVQRSARSHVVHADAFGYEHLPEDEWAPCRCRQAGDEGGGSPAAEDVVPVGEAGGGRVKEA